MQQPSSLIFLAIVVIWAAYLLQHWIRRREALATARSVDQFSDAMRVLERREQRVEGAAEQASDAPHASRPSAPRVHQSGPRPSLRAGTVMTGETEQHATTRTAEQPEGSVSVAERLASAGTSSADAVQRFGHFAAHAGSPKLRAISLIGSLSLLLITVVCAPFGALPWWSPVLMLAVAGGVFWWCRASAMAAHSARGRSGQARPRPKNAGQGRTSAVKLPRRTADSAKTAASAPLTKATMPDPIVEQAPGPAAEQVFDVSASVEAPAAVEEAPAAPVEETSVAPAAPPAAEVEDSWEPVAVPRPTYTMKERAPERPQQAPAPTTDQRSYDDVANEDLPFDGLALDQDLDDLPSVFRAG